MRKHVVATQSASGVVNCSVTITTGIGVVIVLKPSLLSTNGGLLCLGRPWPESVPIRMNFMSRKGIKVTKKLPADSDGIKNCFITSFTGSLASSFF